MKFEVVLADINEEVCVAWRQMIRHQMVAVEYGDLLEVAADAYVSPANSQGIMDGGLDRQLRARFPGVEARVLRAIDELGGVLPVGRAVTVETQDADVPYLICVPTMALPGRISGSGNAYAAMLAALREVARFNFSNENGIGSVAIPGLGTGVGRLAPEEAASQMRDALEQFLGETGD